MAILKKAIELDSEQIEKLRLHLGPNVSLTPIISELLGAFITLLEEHKVSLPDIYTQSAKNARENLDVSGTSEI